MSGSCSARPSSPPATPCPRRRTVHAALAVLRSDGADLVLLDLRMPGLDGMEVTPAAPRRRGRRPGRDRHGARQHPRRGRRDEARGRRLPPQAGHPRRPPRGRRPVSSRAAMTKAPGRSVRESRVSSRDRICSPRTWRGPGGRWTGASSMRPTSSCGSPTPSRPAPPRSDASGTAFTSGTNRSRVVHLSCLAVKLSVS